MLTIKSLQEIPCDVAKSAIEKINAPLASWSQHGDTFLGSLPGKIILFAEKDRELMGYAIAKPNYVNSDREARLTFLAVDASCRKEGVGTKLMEELISRVRKAGFSVLHLSCRESVVSYYEKFAISHSLKLTSEQEGGYGDGERKYEMLFSFK